LKNIVEIRAIVAFSVFFSQLVLIGLFFAGSMSGYRLTYHRQFQSIAAIGSAEVESAFHSPAMAHYDLGSRDYRQLEPRGVYDRYVSPGVVLDPAYFSELFSGRRARWETAWSGDVVLMRLVDRINRAFGGPSQILYAEPVTVDGFVPWHGRGNDLAIGPPAGAAPDSPEWRRALMGDIMRCRSGRIWADAVRIFRQQHPDEPYLHREPSSGEKYWMTGAKIQYRGDLWGYYVVAYRTDRDVLAASKSLTLKLIICFLILSAISASAASWAIRWRLGIR